jgi:hypothetical protein
MEEPVVRGEGVSKHIWCVGFLILKVFGIKDTFKATCNEHSVTFEAYHTETGSLFYKVLSFHDPIKRRDYRGKKRLAIFIPIVEIFARTLERVNFLE